MAGVAPGEGELWAGGFEEGVDVGIPGLAIVVADGCRGDFVRVEEMSVADWAEAVDVVVVALPYLLQQALELGGILVVTVELGGTGAVGDDVFDGKGAEQEEGLIVGADLIVGIVEESGFEAGFKDAAHLRDGEPGVEAEAGAAGDEDATLGLERVEGGGDAVVRSQFPWLRLPAAVEVAEVAGEMGSLLEEEDVDDDTEREDEDEKESAPDALLLLFVF